MKNKLILISIGSVLSMSMFIGCSEQKNVTDEKVKEVTEDVKADEKISKLDAEYRKLSKDDVETIKEVNSELGVRISKNKKIIQEDLSKELIIQAVHENKRIDTITVQDKENYFMDIVGNDNFVVWSELNHLPSGDGSEIIPSSGIAEWAVYYKNLKTNDIKLIEEGSYKVEGHSNRSTEFTIDGSNLVYTSYENIDDERISNVVYCDLLTGEKKVLTENSKDKNIDYIVPRISENNIVYLSGTKTKGDLKDEKIFIYNLENDTEKVAIEGIDIDTYKILGDSLIFCGIDSKENSMYHYTISENKLENLFYEGSKIKKEFLEEGALGGVPMYLEIGNSNSNYIALDLMTDKDFLIYDTENKEFLDVAGILGSGYVEGGQVRVIEDNLLELEFYGYTTYDIELKEREKEE